jgi:membrane protease YdiL (CAAX protease family)
MEVCLKKKENLNKMKEETTIHKILHFYITRILLGFLVCAITFIIVQQLAGRILEWTSIGKNYRNLVKGIISSVTVIYTYTTFFKWIEKRKINEISIKGAPEYIITGSAIGIALQSLTISVMVIAGCFSVIKVNPLSSLITPFTIAFTVAIFEEILVRGIIFRIIEERYGSYIALIISAAIFGALHLFNADSTFLSALCVGIEGGLLMGAAYIYVRNLWFPIAIHFAWNFMQSGIFGAITSGNEQAGSLFTAQISGNPWITGGSFGPEGSIQAVIICILGALLLLHLGKKKMIFFKW